MLIKLDDAIAAVEAVDREQVVHDHFEEMYCRGFDEAKSRIIEALVGMEGELK